MRRNLGVLGFVYLAAHFLIFFWFDRDGQPGQHAGRDRRCARYLWFGTGALVLMVPLDDHVDRRHGDAARREAVEEAAPARVPRRASAASCTTTCWSSPTCGSRSRSRRRRRCCCCIASAAHYVGLRAGSARRARSWRRARPRGAKTQFWSGELVARADLRRDARRQDVPVRRSRRRPVAVHARRRAVPEPRADDRRQARQRSYTIASSPTRDALLRDLGQARRRGLRVAAPARHLARRAARQGVGAGRQVRLRRRTSPSASC